MTNRPLSLSDFKNWLSEQKEMSEFFNIAKEAEDPNEKYIGGAVKSKVSETKLLSKVETDDDAELLIREFLDDGGTILSIEGKRVNIEVESGVFSIPRFCVKVKPQPQ